MMSRAESSKPEDRELLAEVFRRAGKAHVVGLTGVPGSGKSSLVRCLAKEIRKSGRTVGIVAIDPSSPYSGGSILGDRVRMNDLTGDDGVFIRSMATGGAMGGLARPAMDTVDVLDVAGFDVVLIETVGVGQDEVDVVNAAHTVIVVSAPGLGDDVQAIKAGVLEIADIHAVSKCDRKDAAKTVADLNGMMSLGRKKQGGWQAPVIETSSEVETGIEGLLARIDGHLEYLNLSGEIAERRRRIVEMRVLKAAEDIVRARLLGRSDNTLDGLLDDAMDRTLDPHTAAEKLLKDFG
ncbi:MAG: methylmalonyl Co-A mutase-associated GTPase MeaB [Rhodospirillaceae bacterium]|nr:methylmalonyl Co-A mutase-associated GTPase MeaB [Rhodospirillaceae bacterium]MBT4218896.1 methylmalonyl Co-A mutase-associated GTPase MeaB [Rhodospirillaceae bacterium]MBT5013375.1 methylmalonyl Co-A mutase-associated GTPase MeaB [Rhodospirillaceae bacterium]MBT5309837.1 methylmalonyl Co-A mutase-associated GTPase MeaB [Rhodospirillaceae bacterium]MBT7354901.1 methylmalonyl Co-A mutase-associated GTPase MeaB [Rhodospirillaceae bacterium]